MQMGYKLCRGKVQRSGGEEKRKGPVDENAEWQGAETLHQFEIYQSRQMDSSAASINNIINFIYLLPHFHSHSLK